MPQPHSKRPRVLISHQGCVPIYRRAFYERLARSTAVDYVVAVGKTPRGADYILAPQPYTFQTLRMEPRELAIGSKTLIWQPLAAPYWSSFDAVVLGEELKFISHLALVAISKMRRRPLLWWGFGAPPANIGVKKAPSRHPAAEFITRQLRRLGDGYLCYTDGGKNTLAAQGFDADNIAVLGNTVDMEQQSALRAAVANESDADIRAHFGLPLDRPVLLYFGRFLPAKQIDVLIRYVQSRRDTAHPVSALIFGDGVEKQKLLALAGDAPDIVFRTHDDLDLSRALKVAISIVIPGFVGLAITHGFAHGVPMITRAGSHPPEIEYLRDGENGLLLPPDEAAFYAGLDAFVASSDAQASLSAGAERTAAALNMDTMAQRFDSLVQKLLYERGMLPAHAEAPLPLSAS